MIDIDVTIAAGDWPGEAELLTLAEKAAAASLAELGQEKASSELSLLFTDDAAIRKLNADWRAKDKPTNVLSFPAFPPDKAASLPPMLGDIVLAAETVRREALDEKKPFENHVSHLIVHGFLHLAGYDHETDDEAEEMEGLERRILARLAIPEPYA